MRRVRRRSQLARQAAEVEAARPYLDLAREIQSDVARAVEDGSPGIESVVEAIERIPIDERRRVLREVFDRLPPEQQWSIIERAFGDDEIREYLEDQRATRQAIARRAARYRDVIREARIERHIDTLTVPERAEMTLGLFREADAAGAVGRGHRSTNAARRLVLRATGDGVFRVVEDVFNPAGGYFVTGDYNEATWRGERLRGHALVRVGSAGEAPALDPVLYPGGRVDVEENGRITEGRLHLGFAMLSDHDVFADE